MRYASLFLGFVSPNFRKGHMYCKSCKLDNKIIQCSTCKQTFVDAPNQALDQLIRLIAIPCKFG